MSHECRLWDRRATRATDVLGVVLALGLTASLSPSFLGAQIEPPVAGDQATVATFAAYGDRVVKLEVIENDSATKHSLGTGFFIDSHELLTNYHVVSDVVAHPELYRLQCVINGVSRPAKVLTLDVVHDLAIVSVEQAASAFFRLSDGDLAQGTRVYSLGHPHDLGLAIVEGTFNGLLEHRLYEQFHFSGAINAGMSGGPAVLPDGRVVGVNVAKMGDDVGFLVPIRFAIALQEQLRKSGPVPDDQFAARITQQVLAHQQQAFAGLEPARVASVRLGPYRAPRDIAEFLHCWAKHRNEKHELYAMQTRHCSTESGIYLRSNVYVGSINFHYSYLRSKALGSLRFSRVVERELESTRDVDDGDRESQTEFRCEEANVDSGGPPIRAFMCLRAYRQYQGLYDLVVKAATLDRSTEAMVATLEVQGVSYETSMLLTGRFLESVR